jgi:hypothetical protein
MCDRTVHSQTKPGEHNVAQNTTCVQADYFMLLCMFPFYFHVDSFHILVEIFILFGHDKNMFHYKQASV